MTLFSNSFLSSSLQTCGDHRIVDVITDQLKHDPSNNEEIEFRIVWLSLEAIRRSDVDRLTINYPIETHNHSN